jgi:hypothetical protein
VNNWSHPLVLAKKKKKTEKEREGKSYIYTGRWRDSRLVLVFRVLLDPHILFLINHRTVGVLCHRFEVAIRE